MEFCCVSHVFFKQILQNLNKSHTQTKTKRPTSINKTFLHNLHTNSLEIKPVDSLANDHTWQQSINVFWKLL